MLKVSVRQLQGVTSFSSSTVCVLCPYRNWYENNRSKSIAHLATSGSSWSWNPIKPDQWDRNTRLHINIRSWKGRKWRQKNNKTSLFFTSHMIWSHLLHVPHLSASLVKSPSFQTVQHFYHPRLLEVSLLFSLNLAGVIWSASRILAGNVTTGFCSFYGLSASFCSALSGTDGQHAGDITGVVHSITVPKSKNGSKSGQKDLTADCILEVI